MPSKHKTVSRVMGLIKPYMHYFILSLLCAAVNVALTLYAPILIGNAIDCMIGKGQVDMALVVEIILKLGIIVLFTSLSQWVMSQCINKITYHTVKDIRMQAFNKIENLPLKYIDSKRHGDIMSRIITDVDQFSDGLLMGFSQLFTGIITIVGTIGFMISINGKIAAAVILLTPVSLFVAAFIAKHTYEFFRAQSVTRGEMTSFVEEMVGNQKVVQAFSMEERAKEQFAVINENLRVCSIKATFFSSLTNPCTRFVNGLVYTSVGIIGAFFALRGAISVGQLTSFLSYANQYTKPFNEISGVVTELQNAIACAGRVFDIIDEEPQKADVSDAISFKSVSGEVSLQNVSFSYLKERPLITDLNLDVKKGQRIAIVGPTGCGKTTLINLLMRFYDVDGGDIQIDGSSIYHVKRDSLREQIGMVLQETWLKTGTIHDNIAYGKANATEEEIISAAKAAHAHSFIKRLPAGYDTVITEDGGNLSAGQKQLLCIARVMLDLPPILILDEATSSIDTRTELMVQKAFEKMMEGRTSFIVAHRLSTIKEADLILVMKDGHIIEQGRHEELLEKGGFYANLYNSQFAVS
ncbi:MAG: ABC transporter ATP-binding protein [Lachnospiraceae bacterium]|nr:ABC transporter ATP-binding protein [Lachnospiraceae bacterium]